MSYIRKHWFDIGLAMGLFAGIYLIINWSRHSNIQNLLWLSLISLLFHQFEEYRFPGNFPIMLNTVIFSSKKPDRYPLNSQSALLINVFIGWVPYLLAAIWGDIFLWFGIMTIFGSIGNSIAHIFLFNIKGKTLYNPGMISSILLFIPISFVFIYIVILSDLASLWDWLIGISIGFFFSAIGIFKTIDRLKDPDTAYTFEN